MRAAPAVSVSIRRFGAARGAIAFACTAAASAWLAWTVLWMRHEPSWYLVVAAFAVCLAIGLGASTLTSEAARLRWDGESWHLGPLDVASGPTGPSRGRIDVAVDLGAWMLLRF